MEVLSANKTSTASCPCTRRLKPCKVTIQTLEEEKTAWWQWLAHFMATLKDELGSSSKESFQDHERFLILKSYVNRKINTQITFYRLVSLQQICGTGMTRWGLLSSSGYWALSVSLGALGYKTPLSLTVLFSDMDHASPWPRMWKQLCKK